MTTNWRHGSGNVGRLFMECGLVVVLVGDFGQEVRLSGFLRKLDQRWILFKKAYVALEVEYRRWSAILCWKKEGKNRVGTL